jgi:hypothetical protein
LPADGARGDWFGRSVSVSGDTAVVGAPSDDDNGTRSGSAYVFRRTGSSWTQAQKLLPGDGAANDLFGTSVSVSGDTAVVGALYDDDNGAGSGSAYVFRRTGSSWTQAQKLLPGDGTADVVFGASVSVSGDIAIVGAPGDGQNDFEPGSAYVFTRTGSSWTQEQKLLPADGTEYDFFGYSVSVTGDTAVVGAYGDDDNGTSSGSAYVFTRVGSRWTQVHKLLPGDGAADDHFGYSVSVSGDIAVVGAYEHADHGTASGSAYVFVLSAP